MAEIADTTMARRASRNDVADARARDNAPTPLTEIAVKPWRELSERAIEPNGYYLLDWELAVNASAPGRTDVSALAAWDETRLIGLMPVTSLWRTYKIPLPALASAHPYGTLCTPPLDRDATEEAVSQLMQQARQAGSHALVLRDMSLDGAAMTAFRNVLQRDGLRSHVLTSYQRASLDATRDADALLHDALGPKKLKELRRQRNRLAEHGAVDLTIARTPDEVTAAIEVFLKLEASGWKGARGTALAQNDGDISFIRRATVALAATGQCEIVSLCAGETPIAAGIVLRHQERAFYFKLGIDERFAKFSPGVQLTLDITRHLCADPAIASADSTAGPDHPMINPIWRGRFAIGDVLIPLRQNDPIVALIHAALTSRQFVLKQARRGVHFVREWRR